MATTDARVHKTLVKLQNSSFNLKNTKPESGIADQSQLTAIDLQSITTAEQLGALIQQHRHEKGLSQADFADLAAISVGTVKNAEQGRNIGVGQMFAILRVLGLVLYA